MSATLRLFLAVFVGAVLGIFTDFAKGISLSPIAVGFLAGYGVEFFFDFLDNLLGTLGFRSKSNSQIGSWGFWLARRTDWGHYDWKSEVGVLVTTGGATISTGEPAEDKPRLPAASPERAPAPLNPLWRALPWLIVAAIALALIWWSKSPSDRRPAHAGDGL